MNLDDKAREACQLIQNGDACKALPLVDELIEARYETAHFIRGMLFLKGGRNVDADLSRATASFRQNAVISPDAISYLYLARALMQQGDPLRQEAFRWLEHAARAENPPETDLGFAEYHERAARPDYEGAKKFYARAAMRGRFAGFVGLARIQRLEGRRVRGALTMTALWLIAPLFYLIVGKSARNSF